MLAETSSIHTLGMTAAIQSDKAVSYGVLANADIHRQVAKVQDGMKWTELLHGNETT